jgi:O-antigen/teichoic acid export membrane protein
LTLGVLALGWCPLWVQVRVRQVAASPVGYRLARGTFWSLTGALIARFSGLLASILVARFLGRNGFGQLGVIQSTVAMFQVFGGFGLGLTATKYVAEFRKTEPERAGRVVGHSHLVATITGSVAAGVLFFSSDWLARHSLAAPELAPLLRIAAPMLLLSSLNGSQIGALSGLEAFKTLAQVNLLSGIATFPLMVIGTLVDGLRGAIIGLLLSLVVTCVLSQYALRRELDRSGIPVRYSGPYEWDTLWHFTVPAVLSGAMVPPVNWLCVALLVNHPAGYGAMGLYNAGNQWRNLLMFIPGLMMQAVLPMMSAAHAGGEVTLDFQRTLRMTQSIMVAVAFPATTILMFGSGLILRLYGHGFQGGETVLIGVFATALIQCIGASTGTAIQARGKMWMGLLLNSSWAVTYLSFVYFTVTKLGANALAFGSAVAYMIMTLWTFVYLERRLPLPTGMLNRVWGSVAFAGFLVGGALICPPRLRVGLLVPVTLLAIAIASAILADRDFVRALLRPPESKANASRQTAYSGS